MNFERRSINTDLGKRAKAVLVQVPRYISCLTVFSHNVLLLSLRGTSLTLAQLILVVCPAFLLFGYNQTNVAGLATLPDWVERFPRIDTSTTHGAQRSDNATIQGVVIATLPLGLSSDHSRAPVLPINLDGSWPSWPGRYSYWWDRFSRRRHSSLPS